MPCFSFLCQFLRHYKVFWKLAVFCLFFPQHPAASPAPGGFSGGRRLLRRPAASPAGGGSSGGRRLLRRAAAPPAGTSLTGRALFSPIGRFPPPTDCFPHTQKDRGLRWQSPVLLICSCPPLMRYLPRGVLVQALCRPQFSPSSLRRLREAVQAASPPAASPQADTASAAVHTPVRLSSPVLAALPLPAPPLSGVLPFPAAV